MNLKHFFYISALYLLMSGCSSIAPAGIYNTARPGTLSFANQTISFEEDNKFEYFSFSDNLNSRKKGKGNYEIKENELILSFEDYNPPKAEIITSSVFETSKQVSLELQVVGAKQEPLMAAAAVLNNKANEMISNCFTDVNGRCLLQWTLNLDKLDLSVIYTGYKNMVVPIDAVSSRSVIVQMEEICQYFKSGETLSYDMKSRKNKLVLKGVSGDHVFYRRIRTK